MAGLGINLGRRNRDKKSPDIRLSGVLFEIPKNIIYLFTFVNLFCLNKCKKTNFSYEK